MKKYLITATAIALVLAVTASASATNNHNTTNNNPSASATANPVTNTTNNLNPTINNNPSAYGGDGGNSTAFGGHGGNASSSASAHGGNSNATGGAVNSSGNSSNTNINGVSSTNVNSNTNVSGSTSGVKNSGNSQQAQGQGQEQQTSSSVVNQDQITYEAPKIPVATAYAPALTSGNDTCMGSSSVAGQGAAIGLSFGSTWRDEDCVMRKDADLLNRMGMRKSSLALLCQKASFRKAFAASGEVKCPAEEKKKDKQLVDRNGKPVEVTETALGATEYSYPKKRR